MEKSRKIIWDGKRSFFSSNSFSFLFPLFSFSFLSISFFREVKLKTPKLVSLNWLKGRKNEENDDGTMKNGRRKKVMRVVANGFRHSKRMDEEKRED